MEGRATVDTSSSLAIMPDQFAIIFDSNDNHNYTYFPGSWLSGRVILSLRKPQKTRGLRLSFRGYEKTRWTTGSGKNRRTHTQTIDFFNNIITLFGYNRGQSVSDNDLVDLPIGNSVYPFRFKIPYPLPSSIELNCGRVSYEICAYIDIVRWVDTYSPTYPIFITNNLIVNTPHLLQSLTIQQTKVMGCFTNQGSIGCIAFIGKQGYLPGETIVINCDITNNSSKTIITEIHASLKASTHYKAHGSNKYVNDKLCFTIHPGPISPQPANQPFQLGLSIPNNIFLSKSDCRLIVIKHFVEIKVCYGRFWQKMRLQLPVFIGNTILNNNQVQQSEMAPSNSTIYHNAATPGAIFPEQNTMPMTDWQYELAEPQHPENLDVELPPYTEIQGDESY